MSIPLGRVVLEQKRVKNKKIVIWDLFNTPEENPPRLELPESLRTNYTAGPIWSARIDAAV